jgi:hypothetical protein
MKRRQSLLVFTAVLLLALPLAACDNAQRSAESQRQWDDLNRKMQEDNDQLAAQNMELQYEIIQRELGDAAAQRWAKCINDPPKAKKNQAACAALSTRIKSAQDREAAREQAAEKDW